MAEPTPIVPNQSRSGTLQDVLWAVILEDRFKTMSNAEVIGTLEYLKWNIINISDK